MDKYYGMKKAEVTLRENPGVQECRKCAKSKKKTFWLAAFFVVFAVVLGTLFFADSEIAQNAALIVSAAIEK